MSAELRRLAEQATDRQVHPVNWGWWVRNTLMAGPARDFVAAASPSATIALLDELDALRAVAEAAREAATAHDALDEFDVTHDEWQYTARAPFAARHSLAMDILREALTHLEETTRG